MSWRGVRTTFYHDDILDRDGKEIIVDHWEPERSSPLRLPHLLTGPVQIEDVIEVMIRESTRCAPIGRPC